MARAKRQATKPAKASTPQTTGIEASASDRPAKDLTPERNGIEASAGERSELPEGWEWNELGRLATITGGGTPLRSEAKYFESGTIPWATPTDIHPDSVRFIEKTATSITELGLHESSARLLPPGTVLFSSRASIGKVAIAAVPMATNQGFINLIPKDGVEPKFIAYALKNSVEQIRQLGSGTTFIEVPKSGLRQFAIPLPLLPEQRRIVARIEEFARRVEEALERLNKLESEFDLLCRATLYNLSDGEPASTSMRELVQQRTSDISVSKDEIYHFAGLKSFGRGVFKSVVKSGAQFAYPRLTRLRAGDFVYLKLMAWEGAFGIVPSECDGLYVSPEYPVFEVNEERLLPEMLDVYFRSPAIWPIISEISTGTNARRKRLHPSAFLAYEIPYRPCGLNNDSAK